MLRAKGTLSQQKHRQLNRKVKAGLNIDRAQRATDTAEAMELRLREWEPKEAWRLLKGWYRTVEDRAPKPCYQSMERQTRERVELYTKVQPPGDPIPINIDPFAINDEVPTDAEVREVVRGLRNGRAGGVSGIRTHVIYFGRNIYFAKMGCCNQGLGNPLGHIAVQGVIHHHAKS